MSVSRFFKVSQTYRHCEEPTGPAFGGPDDKLRDEAIQTSSFRGDAKHRTRNLEIPGLVLMHHPGMTESLDCFAEPVIGRAFARPVGSQ